MKIQDQILSAFEIEHQEQIEGIRSILASFERKAAGPRDPRWDDAFRMAHTLKGGARVCELRPLESLGHRMESLFALVREGRLAFDARVTVVLRQSLDAFEDWMASFVAGNEPTEPAQVIAAIAAVLTGATAPTIATSEPQERFNDPEPPEQNGGVEPVGGREPETLRIETRQLDDILRSADELCVVSAECERALGELARVSTDMKQLHSTCGAIRESLAPLLRHRPEDDEFVRLARLVDAMGPQLGRLARQRRQLLDWQRRAWSSLRVFGDALRARTRQARMTAAGTVFQGLGQTVRSLTRDLGKQVEFTADGLDVCADRMVLQELKHALLHALRNALVHGIEDPQLRRASGKRETGVVALRVESQGAQLKLRVEDDGRGIDWAGVASEARRRGYAPSDESAPPTDADLAQFLFMPAFSTCGSVTELAGRGMGLSVVHEAVRSLRGTVRIEPRAGGGTVLEITVPQVIAAERVLLASVDGQAYAIPLYGVERLVRTCVEDEQFVNGQPMLMIEGTPIPLINLGVPARYEPASEKSPTKPRTLVVVRAGGRRVGIPVEALLGERLTLIKNLDRPAADVGPFNGAVLLDDNEVALVIDPFKVAQDRAMQFATSRLPVAPRPRKTPTILVVDDSFTTRTLEKNILEASGFDVRIAVDGVEALNTLRNESVDLVIADIEMPRMDGLSLLKELREDPRFRSLPVLLVTSLDRTEERQRGLELGANAYIVKSRFDHQELLDAIGRFL